MMNEIQKKCNCDKQIVWWFDTVGTIIACKNCEITFYYDIEQCPYCYDKTTEFIERKELWEQEV